MDGLSTGRRRGGVDTALWLDPPPPKRLNGWASKNPTEADPWALKVSQTQVR